MAKLKRIKPLLGTYVEITASNEFAIDAAFAQISRIHNLMSFHSVESELSEFNLQRGIWHELSRETIKVFRLSKAVAKVSNGIFNPMIGGELVNKNILPNHNFKEFEAIGNWRELEIVNNKARNIGNSLICLDGIAKGYAVDLAIKTLKNFGEKFAIVNAGGDMRVYGEEIVPINIRTFIGDIISIGGLQNKAIASSATFENPNADFKSWIIGKKQNQKIFSVISNSAWRADALTKIAACVENPFETIANLGGYLIEN